MISIFLCDNTAAWLKRLHKAISDYRIKSDWDIQVAFDTTSPEDLLIYLAEQGTVNGVYFLETVFPFSLSGVELALKIREADPKAVFIFVTEKEEMMREAYRLKLQALDYILKGKKDFTCRIHECLEHLEHRHLPRQASDSETIKLMGNGSCMFFAMNEIYYVESVKNTHKVNIHLASACMQVRASISSLREQLNQDFLLCHKGCLVNKNHIGSVLLKERKLLLENGADCYCSIREFDRLLKTVIKKEEKLHLTEPERICWK